MWRTLGGKLSQPSHTVSRVAPGVPYCFRVAAQNMAGWGPFGPPSQPAHTASDDSAFHSLNVSLWPHSHSVSLTHTHTHTPLSPVCSAGSGGPRCVRRC